MGGTDGFSPLLGVDLQAALESHAIIAVTDLKGTITYANERFCEVSRYSRAELLGANHRLLNSGHHPPDFFRQMWGTISRGDVWRGEIRNRAKDGTLYWVDSTIMPVRGEEGAPVAYVAVRTDITARKERELARQVREAQERQAVDERLRAVVGIEPHCIKVVDAQGRLTDINDAGLAMLEAGSSDEVLGHPIADRVEPADRDAFAAKQRSVFGGRTESLRFRIRGLRGTQRWVESRMVPLHRPGGEVTSALAVTIDVTEHLAAQQALGAQSQMLDAIGEAVIATDLAGKVVYANRAAGELYGWDPAAMVGRPIREVTVPVDRQDDSERIMRDLRQGITFRGEFDVRRRDGSVFAAHVTTSPFYAADGSLAGMVGISYDLTEQNRARRRIELSNRGLQILSRCNEAMLRARDERDMLRRICNVICELGRFPAVQVASALDDPSQSFALQAHAGPGKEAMSQLRLSWSESEVCGGGPAGHAVRTGLPVIVEDTETDPLMRCWRESARQLGYRAVACLPLVEAERAFGVLVLYMTHAREVDEGERGLMRELANDLAFGIVSLRAREERRRVREAAQAIAGAVVAGGEGFMQDLTHGLAQALGADGAVVARYDDESLEKLTTLAVVRGGDRAPNSSFAVKGTACELLATQTFLSVRSDARRHWPRWDRLQETSTDALVGTRLERGDRTAVGIVLLLFRRPLRSHDPVEPVLRMFAARAAAEIEREAAHDEVRQLNVELERRVEVRTRQLEAANRELEAFSYSVSHDLRSPLAAINGFAHLLEEDEGDKLGERGRRALSRIRAGALRMEELIDGLLGLARVARRQLAWEQVDLSELARLVVDELRMASPRDGVTTRIQPGLAARGDRRLLQQVLANLLGNAWKFTSRQAAACIEFGCERSAGGGAVYFVRDDGPGFDVQYAGKLFGAFHRLHTDAEFPGTGIGLATVQRIVQRHGGRVWADTSGAPGATFYFTLGSSPPEDLSS